MIRKRGREGRRRGIDEAAQAWPRAGDAVGIGGQWNGEEAKRSAQQAACLSFVCPPHRSFGIEQSEGIWPRIMAAAGGQDERMSIMRELCLAVDAMMTVITTKETRARARANKSGRRLA